MNLLIKQATLLSSTSQHHLKKRDILIKNGRIEKIAANITAKVKTIDAKGAYASMGWVDLMADFCDPGFEHKEDIPNGLELAAQSGFTNVCLVPNTLPLTTTKSQIAYIKNRAENHIVDLHPIGHISTCENEEKLAEMYDMHKAGAVLFGNGKRSIQNAGLLLKALQYLKTIDATLIQIPDTRSISENALMHEGEVSTSLGMSGNPDTAEHIQIQRDLALCEYAESKIHFTGVSSKHSVELILAAQKKGVQATCSVTPYHLLFTDKDLSSYDSNFKVNPPLRTEKDRAYLTKAIKDGKINAVATHHFPQDIDAKNVEFAYAKNGMISMQTTLSSLVKAGLNAEQIGEALAQQPRSITGLNNTIKEGAEACLTIFNLKDKWSYDTGNNLSKSENTPLIGEELKGKVLGIVNKKQTYFLMQIKGYTQFGIMTAMLILSLKLILIKLQLDTNGFLGFQYLILLIGLFVSVYIYNKNNKLVIIDLFMIGFRTLSATIIIVLLGELIIYWLVPQRKGVDFNIILAYTVLPLVFSGMFSSFVSAIIVNKLLTQK